MDRRLTRPAMGLALASIILLPSGAQATSPVSDATVVAAVTPPPIVTLLWSRTELGAAAGCVPDRTPGTVRLDTDVVPELQRRGFAGTGTVETDLPGSAALCTHGNETTVASWDDLARLRDAYGWSFISHGRTRVDVTALTPARLLSEVRGSLRDLDAHGHLRADGMYAYQDNKSNDRVQSVVRQYYAFGRTYSWVTTPINTHATVDPQRYQSTIQTLGGYCEQATAGCATSQSFPTVAYQLPAKIVGLVTGMQREQWLTIQSYVMVTGYRAGKWDCRSADPRDHWTFDVERYCYDDYLQILDAVSARRDIRVADPKRVAALWYPPRP